MCCCCSPTVGARTLAVISILVSLFLIGTSAWVLRDTYETRESTLNKVGSAITSGFEKIGKFLGSDQNIDVDRRLRILIACSAVGVTVGGLQLLSSILLLVGASGKSRSPSGIFSFIGMLGVLGIIGSLVCLFINEIYKMDLDYLQNMSEQNQLWLAALFSDGIFLLISVCGGISIMRS